MRYYKAWKPGHELFPCFILAWDKDEARKEARKFKYLNQPRHRVFVRCDEETELMDKQIKL